jgi:hypothetical protein
MKMIISASLLLALGVSAGHAVEMAKSRAAMLRECTTMAVKKYKYKTAGENDIQQTATYRGCMFAHGEQF